MTVKINSLELENVKRVKAVALEPAESGLTIIGGRNGQGKTSVLDAIAWTLGGERKRPSEARREGSATDPHLHIELSNGIIVERKGKNGTLKVLDPSGTKGSQGLLDSFIEELALDLPKFLAMNDKEKARTLLDIIGVEHKLDTLERQEKELFVQRTGIGQMRDQKRGAAENMPLHADTPTNLLSVAELIQQQQTILAKNGENQRLRDQVPQLIDKANHYFAEVDRQQEIIDEATKKRDEAQEMLLKTEAQLVTARKTVEELVDESTAEIETSIANIESINERIRDNQRRAEAMKEAEDLDDQYKEMTARINEIRQEKMDLLKDANLPLEGLSIDDGALIYNGQKWDCMSSSEQLRVSTAIVRRLKPDCGFVLLDKLEQMDAQTLADFGAWAEGEGLQIIATRVSTGDECSIIIEDGYSAQPSALTHAASPAPKFADNPPLAEASAPAAASDFQPSQQWVM